MVEDVLEQVVDDWLRRQGYFTRTNVRFGPRLGDAGYVSRDHNQHPTSTWWPSAPRPRLVPTACWPSPARPCRRA